MSNNKPKREVFSKSGKQQEPRSHSHYLHVAMTNRELVMLKNVLYGYLGFLRGMGALKAEKTMVLLQTITGRLPEQFEAGYTLYFEYEERIVIVEAVIMYKIMLVTTFPPMALTVKALADAERLYQCLLNVQEMSPN